MHLTTKVYRAAVNSNISIYTRANLRNNVQGVRYPIVSQIKLNFNFSLLLQSDFELSMAGFEEESMSDDYNETDSDEEVNRN